MSGTPSARERILDAVVDLLVSEGVDAISVRHVAARAGVSIGAVQHHFRTRDDLMAAAMEHITTISRAELTRAGEAASSPGEALRQISLLLGATSQDDLPAAAVWLAFVAYAATTPRLAEIHREGWLLAEQALTDGLRLVAGSGGDGDDDTDPLEPDLRDRAAILLAALDGIAVARVVEPDRMPPARAVRLVERALANALDPADSPPGR